MSREDVRVVSRFVRFLDRAVATVTLKNNSGTQSERAGRASGGRDCEPCDSGVGGHGILSGTCRAKALRPGILRCSEWPAAAEPARAVADGGGAPEITEEISPTKIEGARWAWQ